MKKSLLILMFAVVLLVPTVADATCLYCTEEGTPQCADVPWFAIFSRGFPNCTERHVCFPGFGCFDECYLSGTQCTFLDIIGIG